jgi:endoglycosylceramidase
MDQSRCRQTGPRRARLPIARVLLLAAIVLYLAAAVAPPGALVARVPPARRPPAGRLSWQRVQGDTIVDEDGRTVLLRGFNTSTLLEWPNQPPAPLDEMDAELMRRSGFNVVRLPISWSRLEPERGRIDEAYLDQIAETVDLLNRHGLYVILDFHMYLAWGPHFGVPGAPRWAAVPLVPHVELGAPGDWTEMLSPAVVAATIYFWLSPDWQADVLVAWQAVAARFRDNSGVVGYDLYNEPITFLPPPRLFEERWLWPFYVRLIEAIGEVDPNHLFFVQAPLALEFIPPKVVPTRAPNLVYSPHVFTGSIAPPPVTEAPHRLPMRIREQAGQAAQVTAPGWWGELGVDHGKPYAHAWIDSALDTLDDLQVGWAWWQWRQDWGWGVRNHRGDVLHLELLRHLARPFVAAAPRGVRGGRGGGLAGSLAIAIDPEHADSPVVVSWPALTLPEPLVTGDCVRSSHWDPEAARLTLWLRPAVGCTVQITAVYQPGAVRRD